MARQHGRTAAVILLAGLAVLAGCGSASLFAEESATPTPAGPFVAAPGVNASGVTDVRRLAAAHRSSLRGTSYTLRTTVVVRGPDGRERARRSSVLRVAADDRRFAFERRAAGTFPEAISPQFNRSVWSAGDRAYVRSEGPDGMAYDRIDPALDRAVVVLDGHEAVAIYLGGLRNATIEEITTDGWLAYRISSTDPAGGATVAVVDAFGLVRSLEVVRPASEVFWLHGENTAVRTLAYEQVGNTTVSRPAWVDDALIALGRPSESD